MKGSDAQRLFGIRRGEKPITRFVDNLDAVKVSLEDWPDEERAADAILNMTQASWFRKFTEDSEDCLDVKHDVIQAVMEGKTLGLAMEHIRFLFRVEGLSMHGTHQLVRSRVGICYMQQSHAVKDARHSDVLVPRAFTKRKDLLDRYEQWCIAGKQLYADLMDSGEIAITDARFALPKTIPNWIYVSVCLSSLLNIYGKRSDTCEEHPEMNRMVELMRIPVVEKFPFLEPHFKKDCDTGRCLHNRAGYAANAVFKRDEKHQLRPDQIAGEDTDWTLHDKTKQELMLDCDPYETKSFEGTYEIH